jgi:hypothetical protein
MSYFHTGIRTIIGAKAFHFPVRDGKEWYHLAMVIRHNLLPCWFLVKESTQRIHRVNQLIYISITSKQLEHNKHSNLLNFADFTFLQFQHYLQQIKVIESSRTSN